MIMVHIDNGNISKFDDSKINELMNLTLIAKQIKSNIHLAIGK